MNSESSAEEKVALPFFTPQDLWRWCEEHSGLVAGAFSLLATFCAMLLIWLYLGRIDARDLFILALSDSKGGVFILFSVVVLLSLLSMLIGGGVYSMVMSLKSWEEQGTWKSNPKKFFNWVYWLSLVVLSVMTALLSSAIFIVLVLNGSKFDWIIGTFFFLFCMEVPLAWFVHKELWKQDRWWRVPVFVMMSLLIFILFENKLVCQLVGIGQSPTQSHYYLIDKKFSPAFKVNKDQWKMAHEGDKLTVCGYKIFQLSDVTVLCPDAKNNKENKYAFCVRMKSSELLAMPPSYVPESTDAASGVPQNAASAHVVMPACGINGA